MPSRSARIVVASSFWFLVASGGLAQSVIRQGGEFQVNRYTTNHQYRPALAADADGDFVVTWSSGGQDGPGTPGIFGARFDSAGALLGAEFQVNVYSTGIQTGSAVAAEATTVPVRRRSRLWMSMGSSLRRCAARCSRA